MALVEPIAKTPGDRSLEALWRYAEEMERALQHFAENIEDDNIKDGAVGAGKLSSALSQSIAAAEKNNTANRQRITRLETMVRNLKGIEDTVDGRLEALERGLEELAEETESMNQKIIDALEALGTAINEIVAALQEGDSQGTGGSGA